MSSEDKAPEGWQEEVFKTIDKEEEAIHRWDTGQPLTPEQQKLVEPYRKMVQDIRRMSPAEPPSGWEERARVGFSIEQARARRRRILTVFISLIVVVVVLLIAFL